MHKVISVSPVLQRVRHTIELSPLQLPSCCAAGRAYLGDSRASRGQAPLESVTREALRALTWQNAGTLQQPSASQPPSGGVSLRQVLGGCADSAGLCSSSRLHTAASSQLQANDLCARVQKVQLDCAALYCAALYYLLRVFWGLRCCCWTLQLLIPTAWMLDMADCAAP